MHVRHVLQRYRPGTISMREILVSELWSSTYIVAMLNAQSFCSLMEVFQVGHTVVENLHNIGNRHQQRVYDQPDVTWGGGAADIILVLLWMII